MTYIQINYNTKKIVVFDLTKINIVFCQKEMLSKF